QFLFDERDRLRLHALPKGGDAIQETHGLCASNILFHALDVIKHGGLRWAGTFTAHVSRALSVWEPSAVRKRLKGGAAGESLRHPQGATKIQTSATGASSWLVGRMSMARASFHSARLFGLVLGFGLAAVLLAPGVLGQNREKKDDVKNAEPKKEAPKKDEPKK